MRDVFGNLALSDRHINLSFFSQFKALVYLLQVPDGRM